MIKFVFFFFLLNIQIRDSVNNGKSVSQAYLPDILETIK